MPITGANQTRIPNQKLSSLLALASIMRPYTGTPATKELDFAIHRFVEQQGFDNLKTVLTAVIAAIPAKNPINLDAVGVIYPASAPQLGKQLQAVHSHLDGIPKPALTYQWTRGGTNISGATAQTYTPVFADVGTQLACVITATNTGGSITETLSANGVVVDDPAFPHNTAVPTITGTGTVGQTLTGANGTWTPGTGITYTVGWYRDGVAIAGATGQTYLLVSADSTHQITFKVTGTNAAGQSLQATSVNKAIS